MAKDPAFLFYPGDWHLGTMHMTLLEKGAYIELLMLQFARDKFTLTQAKHMLNSSFSIVWDTIAEKFETDGKYFWNARLKEEKEKRINYTLSRKNNALTIKKDKKDMQEHMDKHMENENENENKNKKKNKELRETKFVSEVYQHEEYPKVMLQKFINYWTELNKSKTKMRFELEKTFEISRRLVTWASRDKEFVKVEPVLSYDEILKLSEKDPEIWKRYKSVKREGERKAVFIPIKEI